MSQVIGVLSGKGGVGKTTITVNLGVALASEFNKNVAILDTNITTSHLGLHIGIYEDPQVTLREVMKNNELLSSATLTHESGVKIVPSTLSGEGLVISSSKLKKVVKKMKKEYEIILMDCAPGLGKDVIISIESMDTAIIVTTPDFPAVADALKTVQLLEKMGKGIVGIIVNKYRGERYELVVKEIESTCGVKVIGIVPDDREVPKCISEGVPTVLHHPYTKASIAFKQIAGRLVGQEYKAGGIFDKIMSFLSPPKINLQKLVDRDIPTKTRIQRAVRRPRAKADNANNDARKKMREEFKKKIKQRLKERMSER